MKWFPLPSVTFRSTVYLGALPAFYTNARQITDPDGNKSIWHFQLIAIGGKMRAHLNVLQVYRRQNIKRIDENQFSTE